jgi:mono/diheme cytochrome c family protein
LQGAVAGGRSSVVESHPEAPDNNSTMFHLKHLLVVSAALALAGAGFLGCNQGQSEQAAVPANPPPLAGPASYAKNCQVCHGAKGDGVKDTYPALHKLGIRIPDENIRHIIRNGRDKMPAYKEMSDTELNALIEFIKTL